MSSTATPPPPRSAVFLAALASAAIPGLEVVATRHPRGVDADVEFTGVLDSAGRSWVVTAPRHAAAGAALESEWALLAQLAAVLQPGQLPFVLQQPAGFADLPEGGRAVVAPELPGRPLPLHELTGGPGLAASLGAAIAALHELDPTPLADTIPVYDAAECRTRLLAELDAMAHTGEVPTVLLTRWEQALEDVRAWRFRPTLVHGELTPERVLTDRDAVLAITDLATAHVGDPAVDLAWLLAAAPDDAVESILESYAMGRTEGGESMIVERSQLLSELALGRWLMHGLRTGDDVVRDEARLMLADLADAVQDAQEIVPGRAGE